MEIEYKHDPITFGELQYILIAQDTTSSNLRRMEAIEQLLLSRTNLEQSVLDNLVWDEVMEIFNNLVKVFNELLNKDIIPDLKFNDVLKEIDSILKAKKPVRFRLSRLQLKILMAADSGYETISALAHSIGALRPAVSRALKSLRNQGLIQIDESSKQILTEKGRQLKAQKGGA